MNRRIELTITPDYVSHWGLWEAIRELLQNAIDANTNGYPMRVFDSENGLVISNTGARLAINTLLLGASTKAGDDSQIGKFGEGYKLALLVLLNLNYKVTIYNGDEIWTPELILSETFKCKVLAIHIQQTENIFDGVRFEIQGANLSDIGRNYISPSEFDTSKSEVLPQGVYASGDVYVGGLFVGNHKEFKRAYNFAPEALTLDRDRGLVRHFDLSYQTSKVWAEKLKQDDEYGDEVWGMLNSDPPAPDVAYIETHSLNRTSALVTSKYVGAYGRSVVPVSTQAEIKSAVDAGIPFQLVPQTIKALLWKSLGFFIPSLGTPKQKLERFINKYKYVMGAEMQAELKEILEAL